jgi:signal transduction histidine kinase
VSGQRAVLVVGQDAGAAETLQLQLEHVGFRVPAIVSSPGDALQVACELAPDLLLMDLAPDGPNGALEAAQRIRERVDLPVVFLTSDLADVRAQTEPYSYLLKPVAQHDLITALEVALQRHDVDRRLHLLAEVASALTGTLDRDEVLKAVARLAVRELADFCTAEVHDDHGRVIASRFATRPDEANDLASPPTRAVLSVPMIARGRRVGALVLGLAHQAHHDRTIRLGQELANRAALALESAHAHEVAQRAVRTRDQVLSVVAHDLGNSVVAISLVAGMLQQQAGPSEPLQTILRSCDSMRRLIGDLLDVVRIDAGILSIERRRVSAVQLLRDATEVASVVASAKTVTLELTLDGEVGEVWADPDRVLQVLENLIGNAIKFTPSGGRVTLAATATGHELRVGVTDTGPGIAAHELPHLFDRFWQAQKNDRRGVGLGLAICNAIITAHGGRIWAESTPGGGTAMSFTLPRPA